MIMIRGRGGERRGGGRRGGGRRGESGGGRGGERGGERGGKEVLFGAYWWMQINQSIDQSKFTCFFTTQSSQ